MSLYFDVRSSQALYCGLPLSQGIPHFRLLQLGAGSWTEPAVSCILYELPVGRAPPYKALSYAWDNGGDSSQFRISCNGAAISVSRNLYAALRRLRHPTEIVHLWVDAICINQQDDRERTHQVGMMREIYQHSQEVAIWLGEKSGQDAVGENIKWRGMSPCVDWAGDERDEKYWNGFLARETKPSRETNDVFGAFCIFWLLAIGVDALKIKPLRHMGEQSNTILNGLQAIMEQKWWTRIWVIQETVVATKARVYYDRISAPWSMLTQAADTHNKGLLATDSDSVYPYIQPLSRFSRMMGNIEGIRKAWRSPFHLVELLQTLRQFRSREATDPRDKVYALLGIIQDWDGPGKVSPDYTTPIHRVFRQTTTALIKHTSSLDVLAGVHGTPNSTFPGSPVRRPSWVTDWSFPPNTNERYRLDTLCLYNTSNNDDTSTPRPTRLHGSSILEIHGFLFDQVWHVSPKQILPNDDRFEVLYRGINLSRVAAKAWKHELQSLKGAEMNYPGGSYMYDAFCRTLCADVEYSRDTNPGELRRARKNISSAYSAWLNSDGNKRRRNTSIIDRYWQERYVSQKDQTKEDVEAENSTAFYHAVDRAAGGRRFFITRKGYIGLGPQDTNPGDSLSVVSGSTVPFILRKLRHPITCIDAAVETLIGSDDQMTQAAAREMGGSRQPRGRRVCNAEHRDCYQLIGDAYVHGIMDGEAVDAKGRDQYTPLFLW
ncbi:heterokaryon incompatibility protein-domain-containing protein [Cladorrhinum sp. PSN332]|nr:heterokaryon incompatibility protein-domain-containing protein [Cladorrhinum sp. PSN332]